VSLSAPERKFARESALTIPARYFERSRDTSEATDVVNLSGKAAFFWETPRLWPLWMENIQNGRARSDLPLGS
jgi:hypothetical protein